MKEWFLNNFCFFGVKMLFFTNTNPPPLPLFYISFYISKYLSHNFLELQSTLSEKRFLPQFFLLWQIHLNPPSPYWTKYAYCDESFLSMHPLKLWKLEGWQHLIYELSGCGFESSCSHFDTCMFLSCHIRISEWIHTL